MNILFYLHNYPNYGGIENVTTAIANYLSYHKHNVSIYSFIGREESVLYDKLLPAISCEKAKCNTDFGDEGNFEQILYMIKQYNIEYIIFQDSYAEIECLLIRLKHTLPHIKLITVEHNTPDSWKKSFIYSTPQSKVSFCKKWFFFPLLYYKLFMLNRIRKRKIYEVSDLYVMLTDKYFDNFVNLTRIKHREKLVAIYNPIVINHPIYIDWRKKKKICLFCGRLVQQKGIWHLLKIWEQISTVVKDWKLQIVGDGPYREVIEKFILEKNISSIELMGFQANTIPFYENASILCMTSIFEGWLLTLTEAMSYGVVPMTFNSYLAAPEIISDKKNGFLISPYNEKLYVEKLLSIIKDKNLRMKLANEAFLSSKKFDINTVGSQWIDLLEKM